MSAAMRSMSTRLTEWCDRLGKQAVAQGIDDVLELADRNTRDCIGQIPDGVYSFSDYLAGVRDEDLTHIVARLEISGEEVSVAFTGTDPQVLAAVDFISGARPHLFLLQPLIHYVLTQSPRTPANPGSDRQRVA